MNAETFVPKGNVHGPIIPEFILEKPLTLGAKIMYALLCDYSSYKDYCWPSHATLAGRLSCSVSSVKNYLAELVKEKLIAVRTEQRDEHRRTTYYYMLRAGLANAKARQSKSDRVEPNFACDQPNSGYRTTLKNQAKEKNPPLPPVRSEQPRIASESKTPSARGGDSFFADFERLWEAYPKKEALDGARSVWRKMRKSGLLPSLAELLASVKRFMSTMQWQKDNGRYVPQLFNFLKKRLWLDPLSDEEAEANRKRLEAEQRELARSQAEEAEAARNREKRERLRPIFDAFAGRFSAEARQKHLDAMHFGTWMHSYSVYAGPTAADVPGGMNVSIMDFLESYKHQRKQDAYRASHQAAPLAPQRAALPALNSHSDNRERKPVLCADFLHSGNFMARFIPAPQALCAAV